MDLEQLIRANIRELKPYSSARNEFSGEASVFLDANENPFNQPFNRYPDPLQMEVKEKIAALKRINTQRIFLGNGSDEPIDLVFRIFCEPAIDNVISIEPTYGMYQVAAGINNVEYRKVALNERFDFSAADFFNKTDNNTKVIFLCSPNNPTGNSLSRNQIIRILDNFNGIVVIDEAYIDFSSHTSMIAKLEQYPNLIVLQTFSKAWGCAGIRLGIAFASPEIVALFNKVKYPYNINRLTIDCALKMLENAGNVNKWVRLLLHERTNLRNMLNETPCVEKIYPTDANFMLVKVADAKKIYDYLIEKGIIVRNRSNVKLCENCLRITIGTASENETLIEALRNWGNAKNGYDFVDYVCV